MVTFQTHLGTYLVWDSLGHQKCTTLLNGVREKILNVVKGILMKFFSKEIRDANEK